MAKKQGPWIGGYREYFEVFKSNHFCYFKVLKKQKDTNQIQYIIMIPAMDYGASSQGIQSYKDFWSLKNEMFEGNFSIFWIGMLES